MFGLIRQYMIFITFSIVLKIISQYLNNFQKNIHNYVFLWTFMESGVVPLYEVKPCRFVLNMVHYFLEN